MGRVTNQLTGTARGRVGNLIYRAKKVGESTVYPHNPNRKKPDTPLAIAHNNRFSTIAKFSSAVNDSVFLKQIWNTFRNVKGKNPHNKIHSYNYPYSHEDFMDKHAKILINGLDVEIDNFIPEEDFFTIEFIPTKEFIENLKLPCVAVVMIYLNSPASNRKGRQVLKHNAYLTFETDLVNCKFKAGKKARIKSKKYKGAFKIIDDYRRVRIYLSLIFNSVNNKRMWTNSTSYLYKGADLDFQHDELVQKKMQLRLKKAEKSKGVYTELRLR